MYSALQRRYKASGREVLGSYSDGGDCRALYSTAAAVVVVLWGEATRVVYLRLIDDVRALIALGELGDVLRGEGDGGIEPLYGDGCTPPSTNTLLRRLISNFQLSTSKLHRQTGLHHVTSYGRSECECHNTSEGVNVTTLNSAFPKNFNSPVPSFDKV